MWKNIIVTKIFLQNNIKNDNINYIKEWEYKLIGKITNSLNKMLCINKKVERGESDGDWGRTTNWENLEFRL